jgi:hypothetical protein
MKDDLNYLMKLLLELHKVLLDLEKEAYEKKNGQVSNNYEYFQLVVNHDDFSWLRFLSELITKLDEATEQVEIDSKHVKNILVSLNELLQTSPNEEFSKRYQYFLLNNDKIVSLEKEIIAIINPLIN